MAHPDAADAFDSRGDPRLGDDVFQGLIDLATALGHTAGGVLSVRGQWTSSPVGKQFGKAITYEGYIELLEYVIPVRKM